jgi:hypothetical protein
VPILPIDLQILFSQMNQVGKEQAAMKDGAAIQASIQNMGLAKETEEKDNSVNQSNDVGDGVEKLKNELNKQQEQNREKKDKHDQEAMKKKQVFSDPALGHHIDIES